MVKTGNSLKTGKVGRDSTEPKNHRLAELSETPRDQDTAMPLLNCTQPKDSMKDLVLADEDKDRIRKIIWENKNASKFHKIGLKPRQKILLCGPPGTGKTMTAKAISNAMKWPFAQINFDSIVSSYLGETSSNLRKIFNFFENAKCVVLFDEFDAIGRARDAENEHGEIKRSLNNIMQFMDTYRGQSMFIFTTNHHHILDNALWRRFDEILTFGLPDDKSRNILFRNYLAPLKMSGGIDTKRLADGTEGYSGADIANICANAIRKAIFSKRNHIVQTDIDWAMKEQVRRNAVLESSRVNA